MKKNNSKLKNVISVTLTAFIFFLVLNIANVNLASTLGISTYASKKVIDIISTAGTIWSVVGIVATVVGSGGIGVGILAIAKTLAKKYGSKRAAIW